MRAGSYTSLVLFAFLAAEVLFREGLASSCGSPVKMTLTNNEYTGMVIGIDESVKENTHLIDKIKETFTEASGFLYDATKHRAFFKNITILVPKTWAQNSTYENAQKELYENSHVRIRDPGKDKSYLKFLPFVKQINNQCGKPGLYMHLTPAFFIDEDLKTVLGSVGKIIVHEFGHLRWGLYDEYPTTLFKKFGQTDPHDKTFYWNSVTDKWEATRCPSTIKVVPLCSSNSLSTCDQYIVPSTNQNTRGSIMFSQFTHSVDSFCDDNSSDPLTHHNRLAPNRQNRLCGGKSSWKVMNESPDFGDSNPPRIIEDTTPTFRVVQQKTDRRVVLVLDVSGSMDVSVGTSSNRLERMKQAASVYLNKVIDDCNYVGIVKFHTWASTLRNLTSVKDNRQALVNALPNDTESATCIGCGIQTGLQVLQEGSNTKGGYMLVISDGGENRSPRVADVIDEVVAAGVVVDSLAFSQAAASSLETISEQTGGIFFYTSDSDSSTSLFESLLKTIECRPLYCEHQAQSITVESKANIVDSDSSQTGLIYMDSSLGNDTAFVCTYETEEPIALNLTSPNGDVYDQSYSGYNEDSSNKVVSVNIAGSSEVGEWKYEITNPTNVQQEVAIIISSSKRNNDDPILVDSFFSKAAMDYANGDTQSIIAEVTKGYSPVLNATVEALVETPSGTDIIPLLDNGAGADLSQNDGIYSAFVTNINGDGRYSVKINVINNGEAVVKDYVDVGERVLPADWNFTQPEEVVTPAEPFSRTGSAGAFTVSSYDPSIDPYPPSRIIDLEASHISVINQTVTLTWTAVGSDLDTGTASEYDFRISISVDELFDNFDNATRINQSDIVYGNLNAPLPADSEEKIIIFLRDVNATYVLAIRAIDENGNAGDVSNIVQVGIFIQKQVEESLGKVATTENSEISTIIKDHTFESTPVSHYVSTDNGPKDDEKNIDMVIILSSCIVAATLLVFGTILYFVYKKAASKNFQVYPSGSSKRIESLSQITINSELGLNNEFEVGEEDSFVKISLDFYTKDDLKRHYSHIDI